MVDLTCVIVESTSIVNVATMQRVVNECFIINFSNRISMNVFLFPEIRFFNYKTLNKKKRIFFHSVCLGGF